MAHGDDCERERGKWEGDRKGFKGEKASHRAFLMFMILRVGFPSRSSLFTTAVPFFALAAAKVKSTPNTKWRE